MKKLLYNIIISLSAVALSSCIYDNFDDTAVNSDTQGVATVRFDLPATRAIDTGAYPWKDDCDIRIYKKSDELGKELVRHYFGPDEMPERLWLLEGSYVIRVSLGSLATATFDEPSYEGEQEFDIKAGAATDVEVQCNLLNTIVEVNLDESVLSTFDRDLSVEVMVADEFDRSAMNEGNSLAFVAEKPYPASRRGYFIMPEGADKLSFCFNGHSSDPKVKDKDGNEDPAVGEIHEHFTKALDPEKKAGYLYKLNLKYSPDAEGHLTWEFNITLDMTEDRQDEDVAVNPSPRPGIAGEEFDMSTTTEVTGSLRYSLTSAQSDIKSVKITCEGKTFEVDCKKVAFAATDIEGISLEREGDDLTVVTLVLGKKFFDNFAGGEHTLRFTVTNDNDAETTASSRVKTSGTYSLTPTDKWNSKGEIKAYVYVEATNVKLEYRVKESQEWKSVEASDNGDKTWSAEVEGIEAVTEYEYRLSVDGDVTGAVTETTTDDGPQVYNSDFETWSKQGNVLCPYLDLATDQWWDSGNHGSAGFIGNITTNETDPRPGSNGKYSAKLSSASTLGVLAAGNIYLGKFVGTKNTTKGVVRFGQAFDFTYRPKALKFWYKGNVGTVNIFKSGTPEIVNGGQDKQQIYIILCNMPGPHIVDTSNTATFLSITDGAEEISYFSGAISDITTTNCANDATGHVVAWGVWENDTTVDEWIEKSIELHYTKYADEQPTWLMITASANKYGDYYSGCSSNTICLDDMELVY